MPVQPTSLKLLYYLMLSKMYATHHDAMVQHAVNQTSEYDFNHTNYSSYLTTHCNVTKNKAVEFNDPENVLQLMDVCDLNDSELAELGAPFLWQLVGNQSQRWPQLGIYEFRYADEFCQLQEAPQAEEWRKIASLIIRRGPLAIDNDSVPIEGHNEKFYFEYKSQKTLSDNEHEELKKTFKALDTICFNGPMDDDAYLELIAKASLIARSILHDGNDHLQVHLAWSMVLDVGWALVHQKGTQNQYLWNYKLAHMVTMEYGETERNWPLSAKSLLTEWMSLTNLILDWKRRSWSYVYNC